MNKRDFKKFKKEHPEEFRQIYGPFTSLEATINILSCIVTKVELKKDGSDVLGALPLEPIDATEFVCGFSCECGYIFTQPLCDTIAAFMRKGSTKTVKDLADVIERAFNDEVPKERTTFMEDGKDCKHFDLHEAFREDYELCKDFEGETDYGKQQCYLCKHWDNAHDGKPCDCTIGKCTYMWKDPNGENQMTFWDEKKGVA